MISRARAPKGWTDAFFLFCFHGFRLILFYTATVFSGNKHTAKSAEIFELANL
jgi:hypothetical protein